MNNDEDCGRGVLKQRSEFIATTSSNSSDIIKTIERKSSIELNKLHVRRRVLLQYNIICLLSMTWVKAIHSVDGFWIFGLCVRFGVMSFCVICLFGHLNLWCACYGCKQRDGALVPRCQFLVSPVHLSVLDTITPISKLKPGIIIIDQRSIPEFDNHSPALTTSTHSIYTFYCTDITAT